MKEWQKILIFFMLGALSMIIYQEASAVVICETDRNGRMCCWEADQYGPNRPYICS